jgi:hypothetical protein
MFLGKSYFSIEFIRLNTCKKLKVLFSHVTSLLMPRLSRFQVLPCLSRCGLVGRLCLDFWRSSLRDHERPGTWHHV